MQQSPSSKADFCSASQEIPRNLWKPMVHYRIHKCQPTVPNLTSSIQSIPPHPTSWKSILILSYHLRLGLPSGSFPHSHQNPVYTSSLPIRATCTAQLILLDLFTRKILGEQYSSLSSSLCSFLQSPLNSLFSCSNILLNTLSQKTLSLGSSLKVSDKVTQPFKTTGKFIMQCILGFNFWLAKWKKKYSAPNESKHCLTSCVLEKKIVPFYRQRGSVQAVRPRGWVEV